MNHMIFSRLVVAAVAVAMTAACSQRSENIVAQYVSPLQYEPYNCRQLAEEAQRISARAAEASGVQDKNAQNDAVATGVAIVLFWPAAFFIKGSRQNSAQISRLKGELEAVERESIRKQCGITFQRG